MSARAPSVGALHYWRRDPFSRQAVYALAVKRLRVRLREESTLDDVQPALSFDARGEAPVLVIGEGGGRVTVTGARAVLEHIEEIAPEPALLPKDVAARAEARRIADWFDRTFYPEAAAPLLTKGLRIGPTPSKKTLSSARAALDRHVAQVGRWAAARGFLAGDALSLADIAAAAHLVCLDEIGESGWYASPAARGWRSLMDEALAEAWTE